MAKRRIGIWLIGAHGGVATTAVLGIAALRKGLVGDQGLVTQLPELADLDLVGWKDLVIGGHDIRKTSYVDEADKLHQVSRAVDGAIVQKCRSELAKYDKEIRPGVLFNVGSTIRDLASASNKRRKETPRAAIGRVQSDLKSFAKRNKLSQVVVVNVASTEPPLEAEIPDTWKALKPLLEKPTKCPLAASSLYAIAAIECGFPYINFTPSAGSAPLAIRELAESCGVCHMGHDGKTGETLLKSVLAPMFAKRNLEVMSWVGHNIFGNMDGKVLDDPVNKKTKVDSKDRLLGQILGYPPQSHVSIEYIESLGDWKTAWDHIHFRGFLGTPMVMQFTWQGCDSILAAPLVLDLVRLTERTSREGQTGLMKQLSCFFKSPLDNTDHDFGRQFQLLLDWVEQIR